MNLELFNEQINRRELVFIGYGMYTRFLSRTSVHGAWLGFRNGKKFLTLKYKDGSIPNEPIAKGIYTHLRAINTLFEVPHIFTSPPLILLPNKMTVRWLKEGYYRTKKLSDKTKVFLYANLSKYCPEFDSYDRHLPPFSILREHCLEESYGFRDKMGSFVDFSDLSDKI